MAATANDTSILKDICVRDFTEDQDNSVQKAADRAGKSKSRFCRGVILVAAGLKDTEPPKRPRKNGRG